jgi:hypothetical protein
VNVQVKGIDVQFGNEPRIFVEDCRTAQAFASLLDIAEENEPLFKLSQAEEDPPIQGEDHTAARGFAKKILALSRIPEEISRRKHTGSPLVVSTFLHQQSSRRS